MNLFNRAQGWTRAVENVLVPLGWVVAALQWLDVYLERRFVWGRLRSQTQLLWNVPADDPPKQTPYDEWDSSGSENILGLKTNLAGNLPFYIDVVVRRGNLEPRNSNDFDLTNHGLGVRTDGSTFGLQFGVFWHP